LRWIPIACLMVALGTPRLGAQDQSVPTGSSRSTAIGLYGFSAMGGVDLEGEGQAIAAVAIDGGHLLTRRLRIRPSGEIGLLGDDPRDVGSCLLDPVQVGEPKAHKPFQRKIRGKIHNHPPQVENYIFYTVCLVLYFLKILIFSLQRKAQSKDNCLFLL